MFAIVLWASLVGCGGTPTGKVQVTYKDGTNSYGSATVVACDGVRSLVVTNRHVVPDDSGSVRIHFLFESHPAEFVAVSATADLCLLRISSPLPCVFIGTRVPDRSESVFYDGHPGGGDRVRKEGVVHGVNGRSPSQGTVWWIESVTRPGESGSAVFDSRGYMVAVVWGTDGENLGLTVHLSDLQLFLWDQCGGWDFRDRLEFVTVGKMVAFPKP